MGMHLILLLSFHLLGFNSCKTYVPPVKGIKPVAELPNVLKECSGMVALTDSEFVALNDSGNKPYLYIFSTHDKDEVRIVKVLDVTNNDWEELAVDKDYLYIGDFGNNGGTRRNLMIYKVRKNDLLSGDEVTPEIIRFSYEGQTKFNDSNRHNFDCEAMISKGDSLFLFSKNRGDFRTDVYGLPKIPGEYVLRKMGSFDTEGLVTGADYRQDDVHGELVLVGYSIHGKAYYPFVLHFPKVVGSRFLDGEFDKQSFSMVLQTETITFHGPDKVYLTNEEEDNSRGFIYEVSLKH